VPRAPSGSVKQERDSVFDAGPFNRLIAGFAVSDVLPEPRASQKSALYILGAGFSAAAGLPLADNLWKEVCRRALPMTGRAEKFREDLDDYLKFKERTEGVRLRREDINFEEFLGFLDIEHYLGLRGSDTWSEDGNESQVMVKTLIGQILTEHMPSPDAIPSLYLRFAEKLQPWDRILTFNYDILLERACERIGKPYRLAPMRYTSVSGSSGAIDNSCLDEVVILKMHGSIDWFDRKHYRSQQQWAQNNGHPGYVPDDPIFNSRRNLRTVPMVAGARFDDDPLREMHRVIDIERLYANPPLFLATPTLIAPSTAKVVYGTQMGEYWSGKAHDGGHGFRMVIIGYSLPDHDDYARQVIYRLVTNYQHIPAERVDSRRQKEPLIIVDLCKTQAQKDALRARYRFIDWAKARAYFEGFDDSVIGAL
jgi:SIR2-like protein